MLEARGLVKSYKRRRVVDNVNLEVNQGQIVGLLGPNGAGKTTTFYMMVGIISADEGTVMAEGDDIGRLPVYQRARRGIGYLSQEPSVFRRLTVAGNLTAVLEMLRFPEDGDSSSTSRGTARTVRLSKVAIKARVEALLHEMGLTPLARQPAYTLSGGERRRVEIARALATRPRYLLLDEPFSGIDPIAVGELQSIVEQLRAKGLGVLITDHNVRETLAITNYAYIMYEGKIMRAGSSQELAEDPEARRLYLGDRFRL